VRAKATATCLHAGLRAMRPPPNGARVIAVKRMQVPSSSGAAHGSLAAFRFAYLRQSTAAKALSAADTRGCGVTAGARSYSLCDTEPGLFGPSSRYRRAAQTWPTAHEALESAQIVVGWIGWDPRIAALEGTSRVPHGDRTGTESEPN
jgi:hypothetical protein